LGGAGQPKGLEKNGVRKTLHLLEGRTKWRKPMDAVSKNLAYEERRRGGKRQGRRYQKKKRKQKRGGVGDSVGDASSNAMPGSEGKEKSSTNRSA